MYVECRPLNFLDPGSRILDQMISANTNLLSMASKIFLDIPYDKDLINRVKSVPGARWRPGARRWEVDDGPRAWEAIDRAGLRDRVSCGTAKPIPLAGTKTKTEGLACVAGEQEALKAMLIREGRARQTIKSYSSAVKQLQGWWGKPLPEAKREDLLAFLTYCAKEREYSRSTMNQVVNAIRAYYERVLDYEKDELRLPRPQKKRSLPNVCSEQQLLAMLRDTRNLKHRAILATIYGLGLRKGELLNLLLSDVETERGQVRIRMAKGNKDRVLSLQPSLAKLLTSYRAEYKPRHWLFEGQTNGPYSAASVQAIFVAAKARSKLPPQLTVHGLRHSFATHMVERGTPLHVVKELLGHESIQTTQIYLHVSSQRFEGLHDPLADL